MLKKITTAIAASALAALSLVSIASATVGDSFDITGVDHADMATAAEYTNFTIANGDPNEEGVNGQVKVQPATAVGGPSAPLNIGAGDDNDKPTVARVNARLNIGAGDNNDKPNPTTADYTDFTIANGDPNEEGVTGQVKVQSSPVEDEDQPAPAPGDYTSFTIANGDPNEEGEAPQVKVQPALVENDEPGDNDAESTLNIGASDPAEQ